MRWIASSQRDRFTETLESSAASVETGGSNIRFGLRRHALRASFTVEEIFNLTKIDRWFLVQIKATVDYEEELALVEK